MPPQPLAKVKPNAHYTFRKASFERRVGVAVGISKCISRWTQVEAQLADLFVTLLGVNFEAGAALWNSYDNATAKNTALTTIAHSRYIDGDKALFNI